MPSSSTGPCRPLCRAAGSRPARCRALLAVAGLALPALLLGGCHRTGPAAPTSPRAPAWGQFRGPDGTGACPEAVAPAAWSGTHRPVVLWTSPALLPGKSSPALAAGKLFVTGADADHRVVYCLDAARGTLLWERAVGRPPRRGARRDTTVGYAAPSPATDGERVYALFVDGSLAALDLAGRLVWQRRLDLSTNSYGHASSPVLCADRLLLQLDQEPEPRRRSVLLALACATGRELWQTARDVPSSWATPVVTHTGARAQVITCATPWVIAYAPDHGTELWRLRCLGDEVVPSAAVAGDLVVVAQQGSACVAVRPDGSGELPPGGEAWTYGDDLPEVCSPVANRRQVLLLSSTGTLTCLDARSGRRAWRRTLGEPVSASPILAGCALFVLAETGNLLLADLARQGRVVARLSLPEPCQATPALFGGRLYARGERHVYCLGPRAERAGGTGRK